MCEWSTGSQLVNLGDWIVIEVENREVVAMRQALLQVCKSERQVTDRWKRLWLWTHNDLNALLCTVEVCYSPQELLRCFISFLSCMPCAFDQQISCHTRHTVAGYNNYAIVLTKQLELDNCLLNTHLFWLCPGYLQYSLSMMSLFRITVGIATLAWLC